MGIYGKRFRGVAYVHIFPFRHSRCDANAKHIFQSQKRYWTGGWGGDSKTPTANSAVGGPPLIATHLNEEFSEFFFRLFLESLAAVLAPPVQKQFIEEFGVYRHPMMKQTLK